MTKQTKLRRDGQQWILDWISKVAGRVQNFEYDTRVHPEEVKSYRMIPKITERYARHTETIAKEAEKSGHIETAHEHFWRAADLYREAQHPIFIDDHPDKIYLHGKLLECYEKVIEHSPYPMKRVEIKWGDKEIQCMFHMTGKKNSPTVIEVPGMDQTKETFPNPTHNAFIARGMNCLVIDGPGQGTSNIRKIRPTDNNYEQVGSAVIDWLVQQDEVDSDKIAISGISMGSFWGMRIASHDSRIAAIATASACFTAKTAIFEESSPRFKQMFMYMAGIEDEDEFDKMSSKMTMDEYAKQISAPSLTIMGEYDPLNYMEDGIAIWEQISGPKELWILEDDFHSPPAIKGLGGNDVYFYMADWLKDALSGKIEKDRKITRVIPKKSGAGAYEPPTRGLYLPDRLNIPK
ncbi:MAG: Dipeptidyl aminopeptidase/acylaminoacyl peptidase [Chloroflexi bacterium]|jgi:dienelactone hydrolase|nr:MAG: Dipeptidyl aminopeptidase/acylaminoacyl peptidase [Chloroflexota bacterium]|tara:strand:+ start:104 stop:1321 length:1218 start_codon:yes stop_codon:yes gene_type:complete